MRRRRIFRPASPSRRRGGLAVVLGAAAGAGLLAAALPGALSGSAPPDEATWQVRRADVRVVDGETLLLGDRTLRLFGLEVPARGEACHDGSRDHDCGTAAAEALAGLVADRDLDCHLQGSDRHGRALGICRAAGVELNAALVEAGWAIADAAALPALAPLEEAARRDRRGLWADGAAPPAGWRRP